MTLWGAKSKRLIGKFQILLVKEKKRPLGPSRHGNGDRSGREEGEGDDGEGEHQDTHLCPQLPLSRPPSPLSPPQLRLFHLSQQQPCTYLFPLLPYINSLFYY